jgi:hypothetical protein
MKTRISGLQTNRWSDGDHIYNIPNGDGGLCLDGTGAPGTQVTLQPCTVVPAQAWAFRS